MHEEREVDGELGMIGRVNEMRKCCSDNFERLES